jgi:hypothetical protein
MKSRLVNVVIAACVGMSGLAIAADETRFPSKSRTLTSPRPAECREWKAPLPQKQVDVEFPVELRGVQRGDAAILVRIGTDGSYLQLIDGLESHEGLIKAAEESVKQWTFKPALCNGREIVADARLDFLFKSEGAVTQSYGMDRPVGKR